MGTYRENIVYISRDLMILGISIPITFLFLNYIKLSIDASLTSIVILNFHVGIIILSVCAVYLILGTLFRKFDWLEGFGTEDIVNLCSAFFVESIINLILTISEIFIEGPSNGKTVITIILIIIILSSLCVILLSSEIKYR